VHAVGDEEVEVLAEDVEGDAAIPGERRGDHAHDAFKSRDIHYRLLLQ
jgi:hypothetical protein